MVLKNRYIIGCYDSVEKVTNVITELKNKGCSNEDITLITHEDFHRKYDAPTDPEVTTEERLWNEVRSTVTVEQNRTPDFRTDDDPLYGYQEQLENGCVLVLVKGTQKDLLATQTEEESQYLDEPVDNQAFLDATDAMRTNVITSTGNGAQESGLADAAVPESLLHDNSPHVERE